MGIQLTAALDNFSDPKLFFQNIFAVSQDGMTRPLAYIRNHKAACTSIILSMMHRQAALVGRPVEEIRIHDVHNRPDYIFLNPKTLGQQASFALVQSPVVFTFSFMRHPLERAASAYADKIKTSWRHRGRVRQALGLTRDTELSFPIFIDALTQDCRVREVDRHWRPQHLELACDSVSYDYLGAMQNLDRDLPAILNFAFGSDQQKLADARKTYGHKTSSKAMIETLRPTQIAAFEEEFELDYALYEKALKTSFV